VDAKKHGLKGLHSNGAPDFGRKRRSKEMEKSPNKGHTAVRLLTPTRAMLRPGDRISEKVSIQEALRMAFLTKSFMRNTESILTTAADTNQVAKCAPRNATFFGV